MSDNTILASRTLHLLVKGKPVRSKLRLVLGTDDTLSINICNADDVSQHIIPYQRMTRLFLSEDLKNVPQHIGKTDTPPAFILTLMTDSDTFHYIILSHRDDIVFLLRFLQYLHSIPYTSLPSSLFEAAIRNLSPGVTDIYYAQRLPTVSIASSHVYTSVIRTIDRYTNCRQPRSRRITSASLYDIIHISYWPAMTMFIASCLILLATGPYSNQSYTIAHLLSMRTQSYNLLLTHISEIVFDDNADVELGYVEVIQSPCLYKDHSIVLHINLPYVAKYMFQFREIIQRYTPAFSVPDFLSAPLFSNNRVDVQETTLFAIYTHDTFTVLKSKPDEISAALAGIMPSCLAVLEPVSIVIRSTILRSFMIAIDKLPSLCLSSILSVMETIFNTLSIRYMKSMNYPAQLYPKLVADDHDEGRISVVFTPGLYEGDITHLIISDEFSKAQALQHILGSLFLPSSRKDMPVYYQGASLLPSVIKYINPDGTLSEVYHLDALDTLSDTLDDVPLSPLIRGSLLYFILRAVADVLLAPSPDVPDALKTMLATATVSVRINYGQPSELTNGQDNVLTEFVLSPSNSGGGDASLFLDAPGTLCPLLHFFVASQNTNEARGLFSVFEYWTRIGIKGYPPSVALAPDFFAQAAHKGNIYAAHNLLDDSNQIFSSLSPSLPGEVYRYVPQAPVILLDINVLPSSRQAFVNLGQDMASNKTENERCIKEYYTRYSDTRREESLEDMISITDMFYYFIQTQSIEDVLKQGTIQSITPLSETTNVPSAPVQQDDPNTEPAFKPMLHRIPHELIHFTEAARYVTEIDIRTNVGGADMMGPLHSEDDDQRTSNDSLPSQPIQLPEQTEPDEHLSPPVIEAPDAVSPMAPQALMMSSFTKVLEIVTTAGLLRSMLQYMTGFSRYFLSTVFNFSFLKTQSLSISPFMNVERTLRLASSALASKLPESLLVEIADTFSHDMLALIQGYIGSGANDSRSGASCRQSELFSAQKYCDSRDYMSHRRVSSTSSLNADIPAAASTLPEVQYGIEDSPRFLKKPRLFIIPHYKIMLAISRYVLEHTNSSDTINELTLNDAVYEYTQREMCGYIERCGNSESSGNKFGKPFNKTMEGLFRTAYNCEIDPSILHFFEYDLDNPSRLPGRRFISPTLICSVQGVKVPWATLRSLYPELISIPDISLHVPSGKDLGDMLTLDLGFVPHHGRASLMGFYVSMIPSYIAKLRNKYVNTLILPTVDSVEHPFNPDGKGNVYKKNQLPSNYETSGVWLSSVLHNILDISRILITSAAYDEPVVSIAPIDGGQKCLILRCIDVSLTHIDSGILGTHMNASANMNGNMNGKTSTNTNANTNANVVLNAVHGKDDNLLQDASSGPVVPEASPVISEILTPGLVSEIVSLMGNASIPGLPQSARYTNPFHSLFNFSILSPDVLFGHICTKLKLHTILPTITYLRNMQYALTNKNSAEVEIDIPALYIVNAHDALDLFAKLCITVLRSEFANIPNLADSARKHLLRTINSCPFVILGAEMKTEAAVCTGKVINTNPASGRVCFNIGTSNILIKRDLHKTTVKQTVRSKFVSLNPFLAVKPLEHYSIALYAKITLDNSLAIGFCSIKDITIDSMFVTDNPTLMSIIIPNNFDCMDEKLFDKSRCLLNSPVFVASSPSFIENTSLCISISQEDIKKANESITAELLYPMCAVDKPIPQLGHLEATVLSSITESMQALPARLQALRYSCGDIQKRLGNNINVSLLPMSFSLGKFNTLSYIRVASMLSFAESLATAMFSTKVLPLSINYALYLKNKKEIQFHQKAESISRNYIPLNLILLGPDECALPDSISPLVFIMKLLQTEPIEKLTQLIDKDTTGKALLSLVPILLVDKFSLEFSNDSQEVADAIKNQFEMEQQDRASELGHRLVNILAIEEHTRNTVNTVFSKNFGPTKVTNAAADEFVYGPYLYLSCDPVMWKTLHAVIQHSTVYSSIINTFLSKHSTSMRDRESPISIIVLVISILIGARLRYDLSLGEDGLIDYIHWKSSCLQ